MRKTKIVCTIGPASDSPEVIANLLKAGMNVARINFSHGTHEEHRARLKTLRQVAKEQGAVLGIMPDIQGPKIRIGDIPGKVMLETGQKFVITTEEGVGSAERVSVNTKGCPGT